MRADFAELRHGSLTYMRAGAIEAVHAFTTRFGGVSGGIYESLNLGEHRGDDNEKVRENYSRLMAAMGIADAVPVLSRQVHGSAARIVTAEDAHELFSPVPYEADALVTAVPGIALFIFVADCVPILLHDPVKRVIAAVHAGWRSTVADIVGSAVSAMVSIGSSPADIRAGIGPSIGRCCFETGPEVPEAVRGLLGTEAEGFIDEKGGGKYLVDLKGINGRRLTELGLSERNISVSGECTYCLPDKYWSHRVTQGQRGSQAAVIML